VSQFNQWEKQLHKVSSGKVNPNTSISLKESSSISKRFLDKNAKVYDCYLSKCQNIQKSKNLTEISGLERIYSKTFIKSSYKVSGLFETSLNQVPSEKKGSQTIEMNVGDFTRSSISREQYNKENTSGERDKINHPMKKCGKEQENNKNSLKSNAYHTNIDLISRKAASYFQS